MKFVVTEPTAYGDQQFACCAEHLAEAMDHVIPDKTEDTQMFAVVRRISSTLLFKCKRGCTNEAVFVAIGALRVKENN